MKPFALALIVALLMTLAGPPPIAWAQENHRAGLVIVRGDGTVTQQCVAFAEESISGYELLKRAGLTLNVEAAASGATVCSIDGEGCSFPQESCFCQCQGSPCVYWSYWRMTEDGWFYQVLGAGNTKVGNGDIEGWRWAAGTTRDAEAPPAATLDEICAPETVETDTGPAGSEAEGETAGEMEGEAGDLPAAPPVDAQALPTPAVAGSTSAQAPMVPAAAMTGGLILLLAVVLAPVVALAVFALWRRRSVAP